MPLTPSEAKVFAEKHVNIWNGHNLEQILSLYADDIELHSPLAAKLTGGGVIRGKAALRAYFASALEKYPRLQFRLEMTLLCMESVTLYFRSVSEDPVAEVLFLDTDGRVRKVFAHYAC